MTRTVAIVSGKGGSGKTLVATGLMLYFDKSGWRTILVDGDVGTGGLSYYLSVNYLGGSVGRGLADYLLDRSTTISQPTSVQLENPIPDIDQSKRDVSFSTNRLSSIIKEISGAESAQCITVGNHRRLLREPDGLYKSQIGLLVDQLRASGLADFVLIDCRGGIDEDSVAVCEAVDDVIVVVETDAAAIQSSLYLLDVLSEKRLFDKAKGFVLNKAFDDPAVFARAMANLFRLQHLGSVPFDFSTIRRFLHGELPESDSPFMLNIYNAAARAYPEAVRIGLPRAWGPREYRTLTLRDPRSVYGGVAVLGAQLVILYYLLIYDDGLNAVTRFFTGSTGSSYDELMFVALASVLVGIAASVDASRRLIGKAVESYIGFFEVLFRRKNRSKKGAAPSRQPLSPGS